MATNTRDRNAFALSIVLWISAALMIVALYLTSSAKMSIDNAAKLLDKLQVQLDAESAVDVVGYYLATADFKYNRAQNSVLDFNDTLYLDNRIQPLAYTSESNITLSIQDSGGIFNITTNQHDILNNLVKIVSNKINSPNLADALTDWRDRNDRQLLNGAEKYYYQGFKNSKFEPSNSNFIQHKDEIRLIKGFDLLAEEEWQRVRKYLTFSPTALLNIYTMDKIMLKSTLNISENRVLELLRLKDTDPAAYHKKFTGYTSFFQADMMSKVSAGSFKVRIEAVKNDAAAAIDFEVNTKQNYNKLMKILEVVYK